MEHNGETEIEGEGFSMHFGYGMWRHPPAACGTALTLRFRLSRASAENSASFTAIAPRHLAVKRLNLKYFPKYKSQLIALGRKH